MDSVPGKKEDTDVKFQNDAWSKEMLRVWTSQGEPTDVFKKRGEVHTDGDWHLAVWIWVFNPRRKELVLQKRAKGKDAFPDLFDISAAGHVSGNDTSKETARKELFEELGVNATDDELEFLYRTNGSFNTHGGKFQNYEFLDVYLLTRDIELSSMKLQETEVSEVCWISVPEAMEVWRCNKPGYVPCSDFESMLKPFFDIILKRV